MHVYLKKQLITYNLPARVGRALALLGVCSLPVFFSNCQIIDETPAPNATLSTVSVLDPSSVIANGIDSVTIAVVILDQNGQPMAGVVLAVAASGESNTISPCTVTDVDGKSSCKLSSTQAGTKTISLVAPAAVQGNSATFVAGAPASISVVAGNSQSGEVHSILPVDLKVIVKDAFNNVVPEVAIDWVAAAGTLNTVASSVTGSDGTAARTLTLGSVVGSNTVTATVHGSSPALIANFSASASSGRATALVITSGNPQTGTVHAALGASLVVTARDSFANLVNGATIDWAVTSGSGTLGSATTTSNASGVSSNTFTLGNVVGARTITATVHGSSPAVTVTFAATGNAGAPSLSLSTISIDTASVVSGGGGVATLTARDDYSNLISTGIAVTFGYSGGVSTASFASTTNAGSGVYTSVYQGITPRHGNYNYRQNRRFKFNFRFAGVYRYSAHANSCIGI